jgi:hypothetical protein
VIAHRDTAAALAVQAGYDWSDAALDEQVRDGREIAICAEMLRLELPDRSGLRIVPPAETFAGAGRSIWAACVRCSITSAATTRPTRASSTSPATTCSSSATA